MPLWTVLRGCASGASGLWPLASCEVNCQVSSSSIASGQNRDPTREMPDDVPEGFLVGLAHVRLLPAPMARRFVASGRSRACGKICRSALSICIAPPNADLATRLSPRVPKGHLAHAASRAGRRQALVPSSGIRLGGRRTCGASPRNASPTPAADRAPGFSTLPPPGWRPRRAGTSNA